MTRKDFEFFARWLATTTVTSVRRAELAEYFEEQNPNFDRKRFEKAFMKHRSDYITYNRDMAERLFS